MSNIFTIPLKKDKVTASISEKREQLDAKKKELAQNEGKLGDLLAAKEACIAKGRTFSEEKTLKRLQQIVQDNKESVELYTLQIAVLSKVPKVH